MAINFHPNYGTFLVCDFNHQKEPEIVKRRPVIVLSRGGNRSQICTVVPLSGSAPEVVQPWHHKMTLDKLPNFVRRFGEGYGDWWAKCDCISTVAFFRLNRVHGPRDRQTGRRVFLAPKVFGEDLKAIRKAVLWHLGLSDLI